MAVQGAAARMMVPARYSSPSVGPTPGEEVLEKEPAEEGHAERLYQPVDEEYVEDASGLVAHATKRGEIDAEHHRVDHQPDEDRDRQVDVADLEPAQPSHQAWTEPADCDPGDDAEGDPEGQIALEDAQRSDRVGGAYPATGLRARTNALMNLPSTWGAIVAAAIPDPVRISRASSRR